MKSIHYFLTCSWAAVLPLHTQAHNIKDAGEVTTNEAMESLLHQITDMVAQGAMESNLYQTLTTTFEALPKNEEGYLSHQAVRYVLHRFFVQRYGWFIKGLEPNEEKTWHHEQATGDQAPKLKEWVPSFLQNLLEEKLHHKGTDLPGLLALAASLEELVQHEARDRLKMAYKIHDWVLDTPLTREQADQVIRTWYVGFLLAGNFSANSHEEVERKEIQFSRRYTGWDEANEWLMNLEKSHYEAIQDDAKISFNETARLAAQIGETYFHFNDLECKSLKDTLRGMESKKSGRVRLSTFYKKSLYSHWRFTEKADYLRKLGALDESDPQQPQVIVSNYIMARPNCLEASNLYAVCCRNECEDLMASLELQLKSSQAEPQQIVDIISTLGSDTVQAPWSMSSELRSRLEQVAAKNGGKVPIHGRLFAQWIHHAYPRECPYPHESGTVSPQTPDEWMQSTGASDYSASRDEMKRAVDGDVCEIDDQGKPKGPCNEDEALPWSEDEELLGSHQPATAPAVAVAAASEAGAPSTAVTICCMAVSVAVAFALLFDYWCASRASQVGKEEVFYVNKVSSKELASKLAGLQKTMAVWALACFAWLVDILDTNIFGCAMCGGLGVLAVRRFAGRFVQKDVLHKL